MPLLLTTPPLVLEGGYDLDSLASSALTHVNALAVGYPKATLLNDSKSAINRTGNKHDIDDIAYVNAAPHGGNEAAALAQFIKEINL